MSNIKLYTTLIKRTGIGTLYNYFEVNYPLSKANRLATIQTYKRQ